MGIPVTTKLEGPTIFEGAEGLATHTLKENGAENFKNTTGVVDTFGCGALIGEGETPLTTMAEVGVDISPKPSPELDMTKI